MQQFIPLFFNAALQTHLGLGCLNVEVSRSHTIRYTHSRQASSEWEISLSQRLLPTQHTANMGWTVMPSVGFKPTTPANLRPQTYTFSCAATEISCYTELLTSLFNQWNNKCFSHTCSSFKKNNVNWGIKRTMKTLTEYFVEKVSVRLKNNNLNVAFKFDEGRKNFNTLWYFYMWCVWVLLRHTDAAWALKMAIHGVWW